MVADLGFKTIRIIQGSKLVRRQGRNGELKQQPIKKLRRLPNMKLTCHSIKVTNKPNLIPCGMCETNNNLLVVTDPSGKSIEIIDVAEDLMSCISLTSIKSDLLDNPFDCVCLSTSFLAVTDVRPEKATLHVISINEQDIVHTLENDISPTGICSMEGKLIISDREKHCIYTYDWTTKVLQLLVGNPGVSGFEDGPKATVAITEPIGICSRGATLYIAEHPMNHQGAIRNLSYLKGIIEFKTTWRNIARCFGMISKRENNFLMKIDPNEVPKSMNVIDLVQTLPGYANDLFRIIEKARMLYSTEKLDITHGAMASQTAEAVFHTMVNGINFMNSYFSYIGERDLLKEITAKCMTTRLVECFFGHITATVQGNNLRYLDMKKKIANDAFTFLLPYINSSESGVSIRYEKERVMETYSYSNDQGSVQNAALIWKFQSVKQKKLFSVNRKWELKKYLKTHANEQKKSNFTFGKKEHCLDYIDLIEVTEKDRILKAHFREVTTALKSRPMRRLRGFSKRRFGTAPTILGAHAQRENLDNNPDTLSLVQGFLNLHQNEDGTDTNVNELNVDVILFEIGEFLIFRGTDGYSFNVLQLTKAYKMEDLQPKSKIFGNFLVPENENDNADIENVIFFQDPSWKGGSMMYKDVLKDHEGSVVTANFILLMKDGNNDIFYTLTNTHFKELCEIADTYEVRNIDAVNNQNAEDQNVIEEQDAEPDEENIDDNEEEIEEQQVNLNRRERRGRGNRYASVIESFLL